MPYNARLFVADFRRSRNGSTDGFVYGVVLVIGGNFFDGFFGRFLEHDKMPYQLEQGLFIEHAPEQRFLVRHPGFNQVAPIHAFPGHVAAFFA